MNDKTIIKQIIDKQLDVITRKVIKIHKPHLLFDDQNEQWQEQAYMLVKSQLYSLFVYNDFETQSNPDIEEMAKAVHCGTMLMKDYNEYELESEDTKQSCRSVAQIASELVLPDIRAYSHTPLRSGYSKKGMRAWSTNFIRNVKELFENGGG